MSTGKLASDDVARDLLQARDVGERANRRFSEERLEANPPKVKFQDTLKKAKLYMNKKVELRKGTARHIVLNEDRALFAQVVVIAEARQLSMHALLSHTLGPLQWS